MTTPASDNLTGIWQGFYLYPRGGEPVPFFATLLESGPFVTGTTHEIGTIGTDSGVTIYAMLDGARDGHIVRFVKRYERDEGDVNYTDDVIYEGVLNHDATEIDGEWQAGNLHGSFVMIRPRREEEETDVSAEETLRI